MSEAQKMENMKTEYRISSRMNGNNNAHSGCDSEMQSSQIEESQQPQKSSQQQIQSQQKLLFPQLLGSPFHYTINTDSPKKLQKINQVIILKSSSQLKEMQSEMSSGQLKKRQTQQMNINIMGPSLLPSIPKLIHISSKANAMIDQEDEDIRMVDDIEGELMKDGLLEEDQEKGEKLWGNGSKKIASKDSNFSSYSIDEEEGPFFGEDSTLNMRIFTTGVGGKMTNQMTGSIQKSDMLFKSVGSGKLFESMESREKRDFEMSIERSGQLNKQNSLFQSVGR